MATKFLLSLSFSDSSLSKKITGFRERFDPKFYNSKKKYQDQELFLPLMAPFEVSTHEQGRWLEELEDEIDNFFLPDDKAPMVELAGLDVHRYNGQNIIYLKPLVQEELSFCLESVINLTLGYIPRELNYKNSGKIFYPLSYLTQPLDLPLVLMEAEKEFSHRSSLYVSSINLMEKRGESWVRSREFISFQNTNESFLQYHLTGL